MNQNQRNKIAEAMRLIREAMSENGSEQLPLIQPPAVADLKGFSTPVKELAGALYRTFGMNSINPKDSRVPKMQADTGMMRIDNFLTTMKSRDIVEITYHVFPGTQRKRVASFRFVKTIPQ
jgi:hypothetical protein